MADPSVTDNAEQGQYELRVGADVAGVIAYRDVGDRRVLVHTEVDPAREGEGLGSRLVAGALDDARARGLRIVPVCPFVRNFVVRHQEYGDVVARGSV